MLKQLSGVLLIVGSIAHSEAQHAHIIVGAESTQQGAKLFFVNAFQYVTNSGYIIYLDKGDPLYPDLYQSAATFTSLPAGLWTGGPTLYAAEQGSYLEAEVISVSGPSGGTIGLWKEDEFATTTENLFTVPVGTTNGSNKFNVSEGITFPDPDPFGHIHGRRFTATKPGLYTIGFRLVDTSTAGVGGGPIHTPSDVTYFNFQAGLTISQAGFTNGNFMTKFGKQAGIYYYMETTTNLFSTNGWQTIAGPSYDLHADLHLLVDVTNAISGTRFFRIRSQE
jgi:hypothetical protein